MWLAAEYALAGDKNNMYTSAAARYQFLCFDDIRLDQQCHRMIYTIRGCKCGLHCNDVGHAVNEKKRHAKPHNCRVILYCVALMSLQRDLNCGLALQNLTNHANGLIMA